jgi:PAS domain S-box-containing protein/diguanylate cyclase (GGDEF)-like protein
MKNQIKNKLLFFWIGSVLLTLVFSAEIYKYILSDFYITNSKEKIRNLHTEILRQKHQLIQDTKVSGVQLISKKELISSVTLLSKYQNANDYKALVFDSEKVKLTNLIKNFATSAKYKNIFVFDKNKNILSYSLADYAGIVSYDNNAQEIYLDINLQPFDTTLDKSLFKTINSHEFNDNDELLYQDNHFVVDLTLAVKNKNEIVGYANIEKHFSLAEITQITNKQNIDIFIVYKGICQEQNSFTCKLYEEQKNDTWIVSDSGFIGQKQLTNDITLLYSVKEELLSQGKSFIQKSQNIVFFTVLPLLSIGILIFVKLNIANPISILLEATEKIKRGLTYNDDHFLQGEFRNLSQTFENLSHEIKNREDELKEKNAQLQESLINLEEYTKALNESSIISKGDLNGNITYVNDTLCKTTGFKKEEILGQPHNIFRHPDTSPEVFRQMWESILNKKIWKGIVKNRKKNLESFYVNLIIVPILDKDGNIKEFIGFRQDITELIKSQEELRKMSQTDPLSGLGNRFKLLSDIMKIPHPAIALINIDSFKEINDFYGLAIGDKTIAELGKRLQKYFSQSQIYRVHADEFALLFNTSIDDFLQIEQLVSEACIKIQEDSFVFDDISISINLTVGLSNKKENLVNSADLALKTAKKEQKDILIYDETLKTTQEYKNNIEWNTKLKKAILEDRIVPFYQAIYNNKTKKIEKYESLIRLIDEDGKEISPFFFLDIAKKTKQYYALTRKVIEKSFEEFKDKKLSFSINLSKDDILDEKTIAFIEEKLLEYNFGDKLIFEIVESEGFENFEAIEKFIQKVKSYGVKIAIDDFGTGYSNFEYLMKLKADFIKIDGSLIKNIDTDKNAYAVVETIVTFAKKNSLQTVAEFVSSESIFEKVCQLDIDFSQGFYIDKPQKNIKSSS